MSEKDSKNNINSQDSTISENLTELEPTPRDVIDYSDNGLSYVGLSFKERFNKRKNAEKAKLSTMTDKQKTRYILDYYKWHFIIFAIAILLIVSFIKIAYNASLPTAITLFVLNNESDAESYSSFPKELEKDYRDYYNLDSHTKVFFDTNVAIDGQTTLPGTTNQTTDYEKINGYVQAQELDIMICDQTALDYYTNQDMSIYPITMILDSETYADTYELFQDDIVMAKDINGDSFPCAINITDTAFAKKFDISYEPIYLCIPGKPKNTEGISQYLKYIYSDK